ncbi:MAG: EF-P lysine aminoacylase EpmA [Waddliaceae bacterium]
MHPEKIRILHDRANMLAKARQYFSGRGIIEVDCPGLTQEASVDAHIDLIRAYRNSSSKAYFLHSSPEYGMKKLLANGMGDIYQLSHVFRDNEHGMKHLSEFMMAEWYRLHIPFQEMIEETVGFIQQIIGKVPHTKISYREMFLRYAGFDYLHASETRLFDFLRAHGVDPQHCFEEGDKDAPLDSVLVDKNDLLDSILSLLIVPQLPQERLCVVDSFPATQAALAQVFYCGEEEEVAERFEIFYKGMELANGYHELTNSDEQLERLIKANAERERLGKDSLPIDHSFIEALKKGLPDCCGVSVGFDRLMMLRHHKEDIADVVPFSEQSFACDRALSSIE